MSSKNSGKNTHKRKQREHSRRQNAETFVSRSTLLLLIAVLIISVLAYLPVFSNGFVNWDDEPYITQNPYTRSIDLGQYFSSYYMGNYHPFTMLAYALQYRLFGLSAVGYHSVNLFLHLCNVILVFACVRSFSTHQITALITALLFGIHPIHVESVAWASELKDLLYTLFFLASMLMYMKYRRQQHRRYYVMALVLFVMSLLSKAMAASLPVILLLIDYYSGREMKPSTIKETIPFFALALGFGIVAVLAQKSSNAIQDITFFSYPQRIVFAAYSIMMYIAKIFVPLNLSAYYPYPVKVADAIPPEYYAVALLAVVVLAAVVYSAKFTRHLLFGVGFFLATVFLVLQLLPVGGALMADRYAYIPSIGILYLVAYGLTQLVQQGKKIVVAGIIAIATIGYGVKTYSQSMIWNNSMALWNSVIDQSSIVSFAFNNRGILFADQGREEEALRDYNTAIALKSDYAEAYIDRGNIFLAQKKFDDALRDYNKGIELRPDFANGYFNRGKLYETMGHYEKSLQDYATTIQLAPRLTEAYYNRGIVYIAMKRYDEALRDCNMAIELNPSYAYAYFNRALVEFNTGRKDDCCRDLQKSIQLGYAQAQEVYNNLCR